MKLSNSIFPSYSVKQQQVMSPVNADLNTNTKIIKVPKLAISNFRDWKQSVMIYLQREGHWVNIFRTSLELSKNNPETLTVASAPGSLDPNATGDEIGLLVLMLQLYR